MRSFKSKAICLLSSAVLLCGASGMTANAATNYSFTATSRPTITAMTVSEYYLDKTDIEIESEKTAVINAVKSSRFTLPANSTVSYQWYKNGSALSGETKSSLTVSSAGTYYCEVKVKQKVTIYVGVKKQTAYNTKTYTTGNATVTVIQKLVINSQTEGEYTIDKVNWNIPLTVRVSGGKAPYTYEWTRDGEKYANNNYNIAALYDGTYKCKITDSRGKTVTSKPVKVSYAPLKFSKDFPEKYYDVYSVDALGGTGEYVYHWYVLDNGEWIPRKYKSLKDFCVSDKDPVSEWGVLNPITHFIDLTSNYKCVVESVDRNGKVVDSITGYTKYTRGYYVSGQSEGDTNGRVY